MRVTAADASEWVAVISLPLDHDALEDLKQLIDADPLLQPSLQRLNGSAVVMQALDFNDLDRLRLAVVPGP